MSEQTSECTCDKKKEHRCMNCKKEWQEEMSDPERVLGCQLHYDRIQMCGLPCRLCEECRSNGYRIVGSGFMKSVEKVEPGTTCTCGKDTQKEYIQTVLECKLHGWSNN